MVFEDWSSWLPCNRAAAVPSESSAGGIVPYTVATAREAGVAMAHPSAASDGKRLRILQRLPQRGRGLCEIAVASQGGALGRSKDIALHHRTSTQDVGKERRCDWFGGRVFGTSESTAIHLVQQGITKLFTYFPKVGFSSVSSSNIIGKCWIFIRTSKIF